MPFTQKKIWSTIQAQDSTHAKLIDLIRTQQLPTSKKTNGENTALKLLHNQYSQGKLWFDVMWS